MNRNLSAHESFEFSASLARTWMRSVRVKTAASTGRSGSTLRWMRDEVPTHIPAWFPAGATIAAATAAITTAPAETAGAGRLWPGFVHGQIAAAEGFLMQRVDRVFRVGFGSHLDKRKSSCATSRLVAHHANRVDRAGLREQLFKILLGRLVREIPNVKLSVHVSDSPVASHAECGPRETPLFVYPRHLSHCPRTCLDRDDSKAQRMAPRFAMTRRLAEQSAAHSPIARMAKQSMRWRCCRVATELEMVSCDAARTCSQRLPSAASVVATTLRPALLKSASAAVASGATPGKRARTNHSVTGADTDADAEHRAMRLGNRRLIDTASIASPRVVAAVTSGPAPGPLKNRFEMNVPDSCIPLNVPLSDARGCSRATSAGPMNASIPASSLRAHTTGLIVALRRRAAARSAASMPRMPRSSNFSGKHVPHQNR